MLRSNRWCYQIKPRQVKGPLKNPGVRIKTARLGLHVEARGLRRTILQQEIDARLAAHTSRLDAQYARVESLYLNPHNGQIFHRRHTGSGEGSGASYTPKPKLESPKCDGSESLRWLYKVKEYFEFYDTPSSERLRCVALMLEGLAADWFHWRMKNKLIDGWDDFVHKFKLRFDPDHFVDYFRQLAKLRQRGSVIEYQEEFEKILQHVTGASEDILISLFHAGLKHHLQQEISLLKPESLSDSFTLARELEAKHTALLHSVHQRQAYIPNSGQLRGVPTALNLRRNHPCCQRPLNQHHQGCPGTSSVYPERKKKPRMLKGCATIAIKSGHARTSSSNRVADALSRRDDAGELAASFFQLSRPVPTLVADILRENTSKADLRHLHEAAKSRSLPADYSIADGLVFYRRRVCIGKDSTLRYSLLREYHDSPLAGHPGVQRTFAWLAMHFYWPGMRRDVQRYIEACTICQTTKHSTQPLAGLLQPLPIPQLVWGDTSMDFITGLPPSRGYTVLFVVVDRLSKYVHLGPLPSDFDGPLVASLFVDIVVKHHGFPQSIVSDRDKIFMSRFCYHSGLRMTPFQVLYGREPPTLLPCSPGDCTVPAVDTLLTERTTLLQRLQQYLHEAQALPLPAELVDGRPSSHPVKVHSLRTTLVGTLPVRQALVEWSDGGINDATWEPIDMLARQYPDLHLEDNVDFDPGESVTQQPMVLLDQAAPGERPIEESRRDDQDGPVRLHPLLFLEIERPKLFNHCPADFVAGRSENRGGPSRTRGNGFCLLSSDRPWNGALVIGIRNVEGRDLIGRTDSLVDLNLDIDGGSFPERSAVGIVELLPLRGTTQNPPKIDGHLTLVPVVLIPGRGKPENISVVRTTPPEPGAFLVNSDKLSDFTVDVAPFGISFDDKIYVYTVPKLMGY
ncbi:unnamed protein product [Cuscuta campestris]|uniref:Integrase catalytic domain-containing protein n=1 Tax=Cuscuta campestris TaxID=132261 RepID=A0A484MFG1_9ASTE|nr:unnamed protein product [Cuscuta campestris]